MKFTFVSIIIFLAVGLAYSQDRATTPAFKGIELYSWQPEGSSEWSFAILAGTNRLKSNDEIRRSSMVGLGNLKESLSKLAIGEQIFWEKPNEYFSYPPEEILLEVKNVATKLKLELTVLKDFNNGSNAREASLLMR